MLRHFCRFGFITYGFPQKINGTVPRANRKRLRLLRISHLCLHPALELPFFQLHKSRKHKRSSTFSDLARPREKKSPARTRLQMNQKHIKGKTMIIATNTLIRSHRTCFATTSLHKPSRLKSCWTERHIVHCVALLFCMILMASFFSTAASAQSYTWNNAVTSGGGGFIPGIIFNPTQQNLIYARTDIGGAYRWDQASQRWIPLMDWVGFNDWNTLGVESIATDPIDPTRFYVAAGTYTNSFTTANGAILRSTDQ